MFPFGATGCKLLYHEETGRENNERFVAFYAFLFFRMKNSCFFRMIQIRRNPLFIGLVLVVYNLR